MSTSHDSTHASAHDAHDDFDPEPAMELSPGEPRSPAWLPVLGAALLIFGALVLLGSGGDPSDASAAPPYENAPAAVAAAPAQAEAGAAERAAALNAARKLTPEQLEMLRDRMNAAKQQQAAEQ